MSRIIEHEIHIDASPEVVFDVVSNPKHLAGWFPDEAELDPRPGGQGVFTFQTPGVSTSLRSRWWMLSRTRCSRSAGARRPGSRRPRRTRSWWRSSSSPTDGGTTLRMSESDFDGRGLDDARVLAEYEDHSQGWDQIMPRLAPYAEALVANR